MDRRADRLRADFDAMFARAPIAEDVGAVEILVVRIADTRWALARNDIAAVYAHVTITRVPGPTPELLGVAQRRNRVFPVYDLGALLGQPGRHAAWVALAAAAIPIAFSFDGIDDHVECASTAFSAASGNALAHVERTVQIGDAPIPIISIASVIGALTARRRKPTAGGES